MVLIRYISIVGFEFFRSIGYYGVQVMLFFIFYASVGWGLRASIFMVHLHGIIFYLSAMAGVLYAEKHKSAMVNLFGVIAVIGNTLVFTSVLVSDLAQGWDYLQLFKEIFSVSGLLLRAVGAGYIREVPMRLGEEMIATEEDPRKARSRFYLMLFYAFSFGITLAALLLPLLRMNVVWMGTNMCWPLPIGICVICLIIGICVFNGGVVYFNQVEHIPNNIKKVMQCIYTGDAYRTEEYRIGEYDDEFAEDAGQAGRVMVLFCPLPIFWALFEQLWSRWPHQGLRMDGLINGTVPIEPDMLILAVPMVNMFVLPIFEYVFFPLLANIVLCRTPKGRIGFGALLAIVAFILAILVELQVAEEKEFVEPTYAENYGELVIWNPSMCPLNITFSSFPPEMSTTLIDPSSIKRITKIPCEEKLTFKFSQIFSPNRKVRACRNIVYLHTEFDYHIYNGKVTSLVLLNVGIDVREGRRIIYEIRYPLIPQVMLRDHKKSGLQVPQLGLFYKFTFNKSLGLPECRDLHMSNPVRFSTRKRHLYANRYNKNYELYPQGKYSPTLCNDIIPVGETVIPLKKGGVYLLHLIGRSEKIFSSHFQVVEEPFKTEIKWQIPQYCVMALAQLLCPALLLDYSYRQVNRTMVPYLLFMWLLMAAVGNLIVCIESMLIPWERTVHPYYFYLTLMILGFIALCVLLFLYEHLEPEVPEEEEGEVEEEEED